MDKGALGMYFDRLLDLGVRTLQYHEPRWLWFAPFLGLDLFRFDCRNRCSMMTIPGRLSLPELPQKGFGK
jgi:hypothetical protein